MSTTTAFRHSRRAAALRVLHARFSAAAEATSREAEAVTPAGLEARYRSAVLDHLEAAIAHEYAAAHIAATVLASAAAKCCDRAVAAHANLAKSLPD